MAIQRMISTDAANNFGALVEYAIKGGATIVKRYKRDAAVILGYDEYERLKGFEATLLAESRAIAAKNDANDSWVSGEEMRAIMKEQHGIVAP